jgi:hypothetical protein
MATMAGRSRALNCLPNSDQPENKSNSAAFLPSFGAIFNSISRVLARHNIKSVGLPQMKLSSLLCLPKDHLGLSTAGVYRIHCECGCMYTGQTGHSVDIRLKEHQWHIRLEYLDKLTVADHKWHIRLEYLDKLTVADHSIDHRHCIQFHSSSNLTMKTKYMDCIVRRPSRLKSTLTISTERVASVSVNHGSLLSAS